MVDGSQVKWFRGSQKDNYILASKLKGCAHKNKLEKNPNGKLQGGPMLKPKPKLKAKEKGLENSLKDLTH